MDRVWQLLGQLFRSRRRDFQGIVIEREDGLLAVCLEPYLVTQAGNWPELEERLKGTLSTYIAVSLEKGEDPFSAAHKAPKRYWELFESAVFQGREPIPVESNTRTRSALLLRAQYA